MTGRTGSQRSPRRATPALLEREAGRRLKNLGTDSRASPADSSGICRQRLPPCPSGRLLPANCPSLGCTRRRSTSHKIHSGTGISPQGEKQWPGRCRQRGRTQMWSGRSFRSPPPQGWGHVPLGDPPGQSCVQGPRLGIPSSSEELKQPALFTFWFQVSLPSPLLCKEIQSRKHSTRPYAKGSTDWVQTVKTFSNPRTSGTNYSFHVEEEL